MLPSEPLYPDGYMDVISEWLVPHGNGAPYWQKHPAAGQCCQGITQGT